ncbi:hypothetical protein VNI00_005518 [Paramarasmius palmivorus]|uniref:SHSP domain-containing protein n=1 Tax=Paramarasmius palmivorus TaxID=297713 RepID=A0AAW0DH20_9AGAR
MASNTVNSAHNVVVLDEGSVERIANRIASLIQQQQRAAARPANGVWVPRSDVYLDSHTDFFIAMFELPGVRKEDIKVTVEEGKLNIEGQRYNTFKVYAQSADEWIDCEPPAEPGNDPPVVRKLVDELRYGSFRRSFQLPQNVTVEDLRVIVSNGILYVQWPRQITISAARDQQQRLGPAVQQGDVEDSRPTKRRRRH